MSFSSKTFFFWNWLIQLDGNSRWFLYEDLHLWLLEMLITNLKSKAKMFYLIGYFIYSLALANLTSHHIHVNNLTSLLQKNNELTITLSQQQTVSVFWVSGFSRVVSAALWTETASCWTLNIPSDHGVLPNSLPDPPNAHKIAVQSITHTLTHKPVRP